MRIGFIGNPSKLEIGTYLGEWVDWLTTQGHKICMMQDFMKMLDGSASSLIQTCENLKELVACSEVLISLGGDGTILYAAKVVGAAQIPILGVKFGGLGFLADISPEDFKEAIGELERGALHKQERLMLQATIGFEGEDKDAGYALNEFVVSRYGGSQATRLRLWVNTRLVNSFISDGIIVATPTGSTAYSMAAGGPLVSPVSKTIIITPINPHSLTAKPIVISDRASVWIEPDDVKDDVLMVSADGQQIQPLQAGQMLKVKKADCTTSLLQRTGRSFFDVLKEKLHWGNDIRKPG